MALTLPKFRWLLAGAIAAGLWAVSQEPPSSRQQNRPAKPVERSAATASPKQTVAPKPRQETIESLITSSVPRPESPVGERVKPRLMHTKDKVRLREKASTKSAVVTMLKGGQPVSVLASDGVWKRVSVAGKKGWVHSDYLTSQKPKSQAREETPKMVASRPDRPKSDPVPRPKEPVMSRLADVKKTAVPSTEVKRSTAASGADVKRTTVPSADVKKAAAPTGGVLWGSRRPVRPPQGGDCQCPYDLMLSGKQCGDHSAYARKSSAGVQCYF